MATTNYTPVPHPVFNELDRIGILLGLPRLEEEKNADYKRRLLDVFVNKADSTYRGIINGVTRELGLSIFEALTIETVMVGDSPYGANPALVFDETKCLIYSDYTDSANGLAATIDRFETDGGAYTLEELVDAINDTGYFRATLISGVDETTRSMTIMNQSTVGLVPSEPLDTGGARIKLANSNIFSDSLVLRSPNLKERVASQNLLRRNHQYYVDMTGGIIYTLAAPAPGSIVRYKYRTDEYIAMASPVIIHNLQSADFRTKMFEDLGVDGEVGAPTSLGADIINELLSVFPSQWGT